MDYHQHNDARRVGIMHSRAGEEVKGYWVTVKEQDMENNLAEGVDQRCGLNLKTKCARIRSDLTAYQGANHGDNLGDCDRGTDFVGNHVTDKDTNFISVPLTVAEAVVDLPALGTVSQKSRGKKTSDIKKVWPAVNNIQSEEMADINDDLKFNISEEELQDMLDDSELVHIRYKQLKSGMTPDANPVITDDLQQFTASTDDKQSRHVTRKFDKLVAAIACHDLDFEEKQRHKPVKQEHQPGVFECRALVKQMPRPVLGSTCKIAQADYTNWLKDIFAERTVVGTPL